MLRYCDNIYSPKQYYGHVECVSTVNTDYHTLWSVREISKFGRVKGENFWRSNVQWLLSSTDAYHYKNAYITSDKYIQ